MSARPIRVEVPESANDDRRIEEWPPLNSTTLVLAIALVAVAAYVSSWFPWGFS
jgi:hypothetical protein